MTAQTPSSPIVGQPVWCNGYEGRITKVHGGTLQGMVDVRLARGSVCVEYAEIVRFWFNRA